VILEKQNSTFENVLKRANRQNMAKSLQTAVGNRKKERKI
jgi:hypothetical protein